MKVDDKSKGGTARGSGPRSRKAKKVNDDKNMISGILTSFIEVDDWADISNYFHHVGFDVSGITDPLDLIPAWLGHYRIKHGVYDVERACSDLATYPRIAARIAELRAENAGGKPVDL